MTTNVFRMIFLVMAAATASPAFAQDSFGGQQPQQPQQEQPQQPQPQPQQPMPAGPPNQAGAPPQQPGGYGGGVQPGQGGVNLDELVQIEREDFGVDPTPQLHAGPMHGPTPASIPGGQVITTKGLVALVQGKAAPYLLFDVLGGPEMLPGALAAAPASQPGSFSDQTQQEFGAFLQQTSTNKEMPLVFYCLSKHCWMSYNAALRAINMGYTNVLWYRGGIEAWKMAGLPTLSVQGGNPPQPPSQ